MFRNGSSNKEVTLPSTRRAAGTSGAKLALLLTTGTRLRFLDLKKEWNLGGSVFAWWVLCGVGQPRAAAPVEPTILLFPLKGELGYLWGVSSLLVQPPPVSNL